MPHNQTLLTLLALPANQLFSAAHGLGLKWDGSDPTVAKRNAALVLQDAVDSGLITIQEIKAIKLAPTAYWAKPDPNSNSVQKPVADPAIANDLATLKRTVDSLAAVVNRTEQTTLQVKQDLANTKSNTFDSATVDSAVAKLVAKSFAPFKREVIKAGAQQAVVSLASVHVVDSKPCLEVFGVSIKDRRGNEVMVDIWNDPEAPAVQAQFIWTEGILRHLLLSQSTGENIWFGGPKGVGKSETASQFAAKTGRRFTRINFHKYTSSEDYIGAVSLTDGKTHFKAGDFLSAFTHSGNVILLDEVTNTDAGELAPLNGFLEPNSAVSVGGAVHSRAAGVLVFAADNTLGNGDDSGRYAGTRTMNSALIDRFARVIQFDYLPFEAEVDAVIKHTGCKHELAEHVLKAVVVARQKVVSGDVIDAPSIRSVIAFIRALRFLSVDQAWATTIVSRQPTESLPALDAIFSSCIDKSLIERNV